MGIFSRILLVIAIVGWLFCLFIHVSAFINPDLALKLSYGNIYMFNVLIIIVLSSLKGVKKFNLNPEYSLMGKSKMMLYSFTPWWKLPFWVLHVAYFAVLNIIIDKNKYLGHMGFDMFAVNPVTKEILPAFMFKKYLNEQLKISTVFTMMLYLFPIVALYPVKGTSPQNP